MGVEVERTEFRAGAGRRTMLSLAIALLLPFYLSLPAMAWMRIRSGLWLDVAGLLVLAAAFTAVMVLLAIQLMQALRARIALGERSVRVSLHQGRGPTPMLRYRTHDIPYEDIRAVELRRELYGGAIAPVILRGARIITRDGAKIGLGYVDESNTDPALPIPDIAAAIATRAGIVPTDMGIVQRSAHRKAMGLPALPEESKPIPEGDLAALNSRHRTNVAMFVAALALLVAIGIGLDFLAESRTPGLAADVAPKAPRNP